MNKKREHVLDTEKFFSFNLRFGGRVPKETDTEDFKKNVHPWNRDLVLGTPVFNTATPAQALGFVCFLSQSQDIKFCVGAEYYNNSLNKFLNGRTLNVRRLTLCT